MAMTWTSLVAPKGTAGSLANWVGYAKLDTQTIIDEAQSLIFQMLRVREMRTEWTFGMAVGQAQIALPSRFLDPIGRLYDVTNGIRCPHKIESDILDLRYYEQDSGSFSADPFTTAAGSPRVTVAQTSHGLNQASTITITGAADVGGLALNGAFAIVDILDADHLVLDAGNEATATETGGGSLAVYTANNLIAGSPSQWTIWDEQVKFDLAFDTATVFKQLYYRAPAPLSGTNQSNWLTSRYPMLMRKACQTAAADFMKDDSEYQKGLTALSGLITTIAAENDLIYRGAELETETP